MEEYNPLRVEVREQTAVLERLRARIRNVEDQLSWFDSFESEGLTTRLSAAEAEVSTREEAVAAAHQGVVVAQARVTDCLKRVADLKKTSESRSRSSFSVFAALIDSASDLRASHKLKRETTAAHAEWQIAKASEQALDEQREQAVGQVDELRAELARHSSFDPHSVRSRLAELSADAEAQSAALVALSDRATALDDHLADTRPVLESKKSELSRLEQRLKKAHEYQARLNATSDRTERWRIHREHEDDLGHIPLRDVIRDAEAAVRPLRRDIPKLEERVRDIALDHTRVIRKLVIDGNNLCYVDRDVVGLWPLREVLAHVDGEAEVAVFFDDTIVETLNLRTVDQVYAKLSVRPHITAPGTRADETILDAASEPGTYVLSNDRFKDFPDKPAVRENRVLRHEIYDGRIKVRALRLDKIYRTTP